MTRRVTSLHMNYTRVYSIYIYIHIPKLQSNQGICGTCHVPKPRNPQIHSPWWGWRTWFHLGTATPPPWWNPNPCEIHVWQDWKWKQQQPIFCRDQALLLTRTVTVAAVLQRWGPNPKCFWLSIHTLQNEMLQSMQAEGVPTCKKHMNFVMDLDFHKDVFETSAGSASQLNPHKNWILTSVEPP